MSDFGFDPSLIISAQQAGPQGFSQGFHNIMDVANAGTQHQAEQAKLGEMLYNQQRQRTLADLVSRNAGMYSDPYAQTYAQGGFGEQAQQAQQAAIERQMLGQKILGIHADLTASRLSAAKTPDQVKAVTSSMPDDVRSLYGAPGGEAADQDLMDWKEGFLKSRISPEKQAEIGKDRYELKDVDGLPFRVDKQSGAISPVSGGSAVSGESSAPVGSKRFTQKQEALKALADDMDPTSGKSDLATNANAVIQAGQRLDTLINAPGAFTPQRVREAATMAATIANGGHVPAEAQIDEQTPVTLRGNSAEFWQKLTSLPKDVNMKPFIDLWRNQSEREAGTAKKQIRNMLLDRMTKHPEAFKNWNGDANQIVEGAANGVLKGLYDQKTGTPVPRVTVIFKGQRMTIPQSRLAEALKDGAKEVK